jgi:hypothetical protein
MIKNLENRLKSDLLELRENIVELDNFGERFESIKSD